MKKILLFGVICFLCTFSVLCQSKKTWEQTQATNTIATYGEFIKKYPEGKYTNEAKFNLSSLEFNEAKKQNTISAYENFIKNTMDKQLVPEAQMQINKILEEQDAFERAKKSNSADTIVAFLKNYPQTNFKKEAEKLIEQFRLDDAISVGTDEALLAFLKDCGDISLCRKAVIMLKGYAVISPSQVIPWSSLPTVFCSGETSTEKYPFGVDMHAFSIVPEEDFYSGHMYAGGWKRLYQPNSVNLIFHKFTTFDGFGAIGKAAPTNEGLLFDAESLVVQKRIVK